MPGAEVLRIRNLRARLQKRPDQRAFCELTSLIDPPKTPFFPLGRAPPTGRGVLQTSTGARSSNWPHSTTTKSHHRPSSLKLDLLGQADGSRHAMCVTTTPHIPHSHRQSRADGEGQRSPHQSYTQQHSKRLTTTTPAHEPDTGPSSSATSSHATTLAVALTRNRHHSHQTSADEGASRSNDRRDIKISSPAHALGVLRRARGGENRNRRRAGGGRAPPPSSFVRRTTTLRDRYPAALSAPPFTWIRKRTTSTALESRTIRRIRDDDDDDDDDEIIPT